MARVSVEARRHMLIDAAVKVISREGVAHMTTRAVANEAKSPLATVHYAFESRAELLAAAMGRISQAEQNSALTSLGPIDDSITVQELIVICLQGYLDWVKSNPLQELATIESMLYAIRTPGFGEYPAAWQKSNRVVIEELIGGITAITNAKLTVPKETASALILAFLDGLTINWLAHQEQSSHQGLLFGAATAISAVFEMAPRD